MKKKLLLIVMVISALTACVPDVLPKEAESQGLVVDVLTQNNSGQSITSTPFQPIIPTPTVTLLPFTTLWIGDAVPDTMIDMIEFSNQANIVSNKDEASLILDVVGDEKTFTADWVYALVAPFSTIVDGVSYEEIHRHWQGQTNNSFGGSPLLMDVSTYQAFVDKWGEAGEGSVRIVEDEENILEQAWNSQPSWAIIPFEQLSPRWKVIRIDEASPLDKSFDLNTYPLKVAFGLTVPDDNIDRSEDILLPAINREEDKMTVVVVTGVTALVRATGAKMERLGMTYPGEGVRDWLVDADITHVSNEVSFSPDCPDADPYQENLRFCSKPEYFELLDYVGIDVIELTGNHVLDWGRDAFQYTLELYQERDYDYYAGGENSAEAKKPLLIEHNGNKIAFIGCNPAGPPSVWATATESGAANCEDYGWIKEEVSRLSDEGYLPIVTLQYNEHYSISATSYQKRDFLPLAEAGAVIVSGSQAHFPNAMTFSGDSFVHFGLGNLFFDQMDFLVPGIQREFIDRHVFYDGRYIGSELLTAYLEDFARPRPMSVQERQAFLQEAFNASEW